MSRETRSGGMIKQHGAGFFGALFGDKSSDSDNTRYSPETRKGSSYDSETGYHLNYEQKKMRERDRYRELQYTRAVDSEQNLIDSYENLAKVSRNYYKSYNKHLGNLITLDENVGMHGLEKTFKTQVVKNVFKGNDQIDRANPLLLRNFLVSNATMPRNFRKEHLLSQVRYILRKFNPKDELLVQSIDITMEGNKATIKLRGLNGDLYERTATVDEDFNLDLSDLKRNLKDVLLAIKRKMDFEIEIVSDFDLGSNDMEIPGLNFLDDDTALNKRLKDLEMGKSLRADGPIPLSQMSAKVSKKKSAPKRNVIFGISDVKPKREILLDVGPAPPQIPGDQGFGEPRALEKKPFILDENLAKIFEGGPAAMFAPPAPAAAPDATVAAPIATAPGFTGTAAPLFGPGPAIGMPAAAPAVDTRDELEKKCNSLTAQGEEACRNTLGCYYNKKISPPKCHRSMKP